MEENFFEAQYDITKKSKLRRFYESNKILIFSSFVILIVIIVTLSLYFNNKEKKRILLSENYIQAKIYLENGKTIEATDILKEVTYTNNPTYSALSFFLILNQNLITDQKELLKMFNHLLNNNKYKTEVKNLLIYKKALFSSNFVNESELLLNIKPLLDEESLWKPHALLLVGDYFAARGEYLKAKEFYIQILNIKNLQMDLYNQAKLQLALIAND